MQHSPVMPSQKVHRSDSDDLSATVTPDISPTPLPRSPRSVGPRSAHLRSPCPPPERRPSDYNSHGPEQWFGAGFEMSPSSNSVSPTIPSSETNQRLGAIPEAPCDKFHQIDIAGTVPRGFWIRKWKNLARAAAHPPLPAQIPRQLEFRRIMTGRGGSSPESRESENFTLSEGRSACGSRPDVMQAGTLQPVEEPPQHHFQLAHKLPIVCDRNDRELAHAAYFAYATAQFGAMPVLAHSPDPNRQDSLEVVLRQLRSSRLSAA